MAIEHARASEDAGIPAAARAAWDVMLIDAAVDGGPSGGGTLTGVARLAAGVGTRPRSLARRGRRFGGELISIAAGRSERRPVKGDRRFTDPAWEGNPLFRRLLQSYLAAGDTVSGLIDDAEFDWAAERRARFAAGNVLDALAPTNFPWSNPAVIKETIDHGGANLARGARRLARDVSKPPRLPATVDTTKFAVGENLAVTPGRIVLRTDVFELIQYQPSTPEVREQPLLIVPPMINKYYAIDLAPGRSLVEHHVAAGQQVFLISWRNPGAEQGHYDLDTYAEAMLEARDAAAAISRSGRVGILAACSGGIVAAVALAHLGARGMLHERVSTLTLLVCMLDVRRAGTTSALVSREVAAAAVAESARRGFVDGRALAGVFAWLRPNDLIWSYVVNNYLLGRALPAFDILYWNQDTVRMSAGLHRDFVHFALENALTRPGGLEVLGTPLDLGQIDVPSYVIAGANDHIVPWETALRSAALLGGSPRFVLSASGHVQAIVNPPGPDSRSSYRAEDGLPDDPDEWRLSAPTHRGSWWSDHGQWLAERSGELRAAPKRLGNTRYKATAKAPGTYVLAS
jgi:polyhydroxyalkanoate synthase